MEPIPVTLLKTGKKYLLKPCCDQCSANVNIEEINSFSGEVLVAHCPRCGNYLKVIEETEQKEVKMTDKVNEFGCPVPIYDDYIIIQNHKNDLPDGMELQESADAGYWRDKDGQLHIWLSKDINPWRTIPHECVHIANRILAEREVVYFPTQDEALAYLVGFLCENVAQAYNALYKTDNS